ncbi:MAG TPA: M1 family aminopeptidase [Longimicrobiales bacterium]
MKFREVFRYEIDHLFRSKTTWLYLAFVFALCFLMIVGDAQPGHTIKVNAPEHLAEIMLVMGIVGLAISAGVFGEAAVRDFQSGMEPLLFTTAMSRSDHLGGRFAAALAINLMILLAAPLGMFTATQVLTVEPGVFAPFRWAAYAQPFVLYVVPNTVLAGAIMFTAGKLTRQVIPVYLTGIAIGVSYLFASAFLEAIGNPVLTMLADPVGVGATDVVTRYRTVAERNTMLIGFPPTLIMNRALWLTAAAAVLVALHRRFRFAHPDSDRKRDSQTAADRFDTQNEPLRAKPVEVPRINGTFTARTTFAQVSAVAGRSLTQIAGSRWFALVLTACVGLVLLFGWNAGDTVLESSVWLRTFLVTEAVLGMRAGPIPYLLIALYAGELVWKQREVDEADIADATPTGEGAALLGRFLALALIIMMIQVAYMAGGILLQALHGYYDFELGLYIRTLFGMKLVSYLILAALAMIVHVIVNQKYVGHIAVLIAFAAPYGLLQTGWVQHNLLLFGRAPAWTYSDMNGFGPFLAPYLWFKAYWASWALLLGVAGALFWMRGRESALKRRVVRARERLRGTVAHVGAAAAGLILLFGGFIFYNTNVVNHYRPGFAASAPQAEYEKRFSRYADLPQPIITAATLRVEIRPEVPSAELRGSFTLLNATGARLDAVHVVLDPQIEARALQLDRGAQVVQSGGEIDYRIYRLDRTLAPGDSIQLSFDVVFQPRGFGNDGAQTDLTASSAYFNRGWLPFIGYQPALELQNDDARRALGLPAAAGLPPQSDTSAARHTTVRNEDRVTVDAVIGTTIDQTAVTPGDLVRTWTEGDRRYFHYRTQQPLPFGATVFSGRYAIVQDRWQDVDLRIYHHPAHTYVLDRMLRSMKASLAYYTAHFGPYQGAQLTIVEIPRYGRFGRAHPQMVAFTEDNLLTRVKDGELDQTFFGTAHEIAHQWWGGQVEHAMVRGAAMLSETLANYSAMMVVEKTYGPDAARKVYDYQMDRYLQRRSAFPTDVPLRDVEDHPHISYGKGAVAMYSLREAIGEDAVNVALQRFAAKYANTGPPFATSLDLLAELRAVTPDSMAYILTDLFETVTLWDVKAEQAVVQGTAGSYEVSLDVVARKVRADSVGNETEVPMNDVVDIGVFAAGAGNQPVKELYHRMHRIHSGRQTLRITVPEKPSSAGIDPRNRLIDRNRKDNTVAVTTQASPGQ